MAFSNSFKEVVCKSKDFAALVGAQKVETEHLLYGLLADNSSYASKMLNDLGVTKDAYKKVIFSYLKKNQMDISVKLIFQKQAIVFFQKLQLFMKKIS